jgi:hypothetical protein
MSMSEVENQRKNLQISGYQHPTKLQSKTNKLYKTFNKESKEKAYGKSKYSEIYATFSSEKSMRQCPYCQEDALYECSCPLKDKQCSNGHVWYIDKNGVIKKGDPHD